MHLNWASHMWNWAEIVKTLKKGIFLEALWHLKKGFLNKDILLHKTARVP